MYIGTNVLMYERWLVLKVWYTATWPAGPMLSPFHRLTLLVHVSQKSTKITDVTFQFGEHEVKKADKYKYLGIYLNEYLDYQSVANTLSGASGRALDSVVSKFKSFRNVGFKTYSKLYH